MPEEVLVERTKCPLCGLEVPAPELEECFICHASFCQYCAVLDYGRKFCSNRCRGFFFWGDGEGDERDY